MRTTLLLILPMFFLAEASETKIKLAQMPPAVRKTVEEESKGAVVRGYQKEVENGKTFYEVETTVNGKSRDVSIDESGAVAEVEQEVDLASIPAAAKATLEKEGKVLKVESVTKGSVVTYEAKVQSGAKKREVTVSAEGQKQ